MLNAGVVANRLLLGQADSAGRSALTRFDDDALASTAPHTVIVFEGINDILRSSPRTDPAPIIDAYRAAVNDFIRTGGLFDTVVDFDAVRDKADPAKLDPDFDCGDHLHPNDAGYRAIANAVPLDRL